MKRLILVLVVLVFFITAGCNRKKEVLPKEEVTVNTTESLIPETQKLPEIFKQEIVSNLATMHYIDFETSSWEREYMPEFIMIHFMNGVVVSKEDPYNYEIVRDIFSEKGVGINYIIDREGNIECMLPENRAAWHAGAGEFLGDEKYTNKMNMYSVGIELLAIGSENDMKQYINEETYNSLDDSLIGFTDAQYESLNLLVDELCERYSIPKDKSRIIGHEEYSPHKSDPGELFDWNRLV